MLYAGIIKIAFIIQLILQEGLAATNPKTTTRSSKAPATLKKDLTISESKWPKSLRGYYHLSFIRVSPDIYIKKAELPSTNEVCVIKVFAYYKTNNFNEEVRIMKKLTKKGGNHTVKYYQHYEVMSSTNSTDAISYYLVMEYLNGSNLVDFLNHDKELPAEEAELRLKSFIFQTISGIMTFDPDEILLGLYPDNIMIVDDFRVVVIDYEKTYKLPAGKKNAKYDDVLDSLGLFARLEAPPECFYAEVWGKHHTVKMIDYNFNAWMLGALGWKLYKNEAFSTMPSLRVNAMPMYNQSVETHESRIASIMSSNLSNDAKDLFCKLFKLNPSERIGARDGMKEILQHKFLKQTQFALVIFQ